jgi:hypothetical protein
MEIAAGNPVFTLVIVGVTRSFSDDARLTLSSGVQVRDYLVRHRHQYDLVLFMDSFDTFVFASPEEIVEKFLAFQAPMVVSGEVNMWPEPHLKVPCSPSLPCPALLHVPSLRTYVCADGRTSMQYRVTLPDILGSSSTIYIFTPV